MFGKSEYIGLTIQDDAIRVARLRVEGKNIKLVKLDRFSLVEKIADESDTQDSGGETADAAFGEEDADDIFGLDEDEEDRIIIDFPKKLCEMTMPEFYHVEDEELHRFLLSIKMNNSPR